MIPSTDREAISLIIDGLIERGCVITNSRDGEGEDLSYTDKESALDWLTSCDESVMHIDLPNGQDSWVFFVLGNEPIEVACDHHINLSEFIDPIIDPWWN
jgi:hypothetical protein